MKRIKRFFNKKTKTGASLLVVLVSVTMLIAMGTSFGLIAMSSYNNSHRRLCEQQAYLTAESCLSILGQKFASDDNASMVMEIGQKLESQYMIDIGNNPDHYILDTQVIIAELEEKDDPGVVTVPGNKVEANLIDIIGGCTILASYGDVSRNTIKLTAIGRYQGFTSTISMRVSLSKKASIELKKVFSNSQSWKTPIVTLIAGETTGDMYFASPGEYERWPNGEIKDNTYNQTLRSNVYGKVASGNSQNKVYAHTKPFGIDNKPLKTMHTRVPVGQLLTNLTKHVNYSYPTNQFDQTLQSFIDNNIRPKQHNLLYAETPTNDMLYSNFYIDPKDNGVDQTLPDNTSVVHTQNGDRITFTSTGTNDFWHSSYDRKHYVRKDYSIASDLSNLWYNDWVEIYMFTGKDYSNNDPNNKPIVDGDMFVNTQALIGLFDRNKDQVRYWHYYDTDYNFYNTYSRSYQNKIERKYVTYNGQNFNNDENSSSFPYMFRNGQNLGGHFEHGSEDDLFFNYTKHTPPMASASTTCHNGNMYLFKDARIECYDSVHTPHARRGVKNNIYAHGDLVMDGYVSYAVGDAYMSNDLPSKRNIQIYGDVMCEGNMTIADAVIYGDVYCNGSELNIKDSIIYGNVYHNGKLFRMDGTEVKSGVLETGGVTINCKGGDVIIEGRDNDPAKNPDSGKMRPERQNHKYTTVETTGTMANMLYTDEYWGAVCTNTSIEGFLLSDVNTKIVTANHRNGKEVSMIDATARLQTDTYGSILCTKMLAFDGKGRYYFDHSYTYPNEGNALIALGNNRLWVKEVCMAERIGIFTVEGSLVDTSRSTVSRTSTNDKIFMYGDERDNNQTNYRFNKLFIGQGGLESIGCGAMYQKHVKDINGALQWKAKGVWLKNIEVKEAYNYGNKANFDSIGGGPESQHIYHSLVGVSDDTYNSTIENTTYYNTKYYSVDGSFTGQNHRVENTTTDPANNLPIVDMSAFIKEQAYDYIVAEVTKQLKGMVGIDGKPQDCSGQYAFPAKEKVTTMAQAVQIAADYMVNFKLPRRVNNYYNFLKTKDYNPIKTVTDWNIQDKGMYPKYDANAMDGVWRNITILRWSAPTFDPNKESEKNLAYIELMPGLGTASITLADLASNNIGRYTDASMTQFVIDRNFYIKPNDNNEVAKLYIPTGVTVIFESGLRNLHCILTGGIELADNSAVNIRGGGMTFLYLGRDVEKPTTSTVAVDNTVTTSPVDNPLFVMGVNAKFGQKLGVDPTKATRDSIYVISNDAGLVDMDAGASIEGYVYMPHSYLRINEIVEENNAASEGTHTKIIKGSMIVESMVVDLTNGYDVVNRMFRNLVFEYVEAPLIIDKNIQYGDTTEDLQEYGKDSWGLIGFEY